VAQIPLVSLENIEIDTLVEKIGDVKLGLFTFSDIFLNDDKTLPHLSKALQWAAARDAVTKAKTAALINNTLFLYTQKNESAKSAFIPLREAFNFFSTEEFRTVLRGVQLAQWSENTIFCAGCSQNLVLSKNETAKVCEKCSRNFYPQFSPAMIVLVHREREGRREILLARGLPPRRFFSCLAGFAEAGETLEETVHREVYEEAKIKIKNLRYFGSQPWPFPSQMMIGYHAEWQSGDLQIDPNEIAEAGWYTRDNLPLLPMNKSIAWQLINHALDESLT
jgi:NAD+ diphosphatase